MVGASHRSSWRQASRRRSRRCTSRRTNLARAYYGTDTRAYQLLAGAALALDAAAAARRAAWRSASRDGSSAVALAGVVAARHVGVRLGPITRGVAVAALAVVLLAALENTRGGAVKRLLSSRPAHLPRSDLVRRVPLALAGHRDRRPRPDLSRSALLVISCVLGDRPRGAQLPSHRAADPPVTAPRPLQGPDRRGRLRGEHPARRRRDAGDPRSGKRPVSRRSRLTDPRRDRDCSTGGSRRTTSRSSRLCRQAGGPVHGRARRREPESC